MMVRIVGSWILHMLAIQKRFPQELRAVCRCHLRPSEHQERQQRFRQAMLEENCRCDAMRSQRAVHVDGVSDLFAKVVESFRIARVHEPVDVIVSERKSQAGAGTRVEHVRAREREVGHFAGGARLLCNVRDESFGLLRYEAETYMQRVAGANMARFVRTGRRDALDAIGGLAAAPATIREEADGRSLRQGR